MRIPLPYTFHPVPGESFPSYLERHAAHAEAPLLATMERTGLIPNERSSNLLSGYGITLPDDLLNEFAHATRLTPDVIRDMHLSSYDGVCLDMSDFDPSQGGYRTLRQREWLYITGSHVCTACLRENGGAWLLRWRLPWSFYCTRHHSTLLDLCLACYRRPTSGRRDQQTKPAFPTLVPTPGRCTNAPTKHGKRGKASTPCGYDFTSLAMATPGAAPEALLEFQAQRAINKALDTNQAIVAGYPVTAMTYFSVLKAICSTLFYAATSEDLEVVTDGEINPHWVEAFDEFAYISSLPAEEREQYPACGWPNGKATVRLTGGAPESTSLMGAALSVAHVIASQSTLQDMSERLEPIFGKAAEKAKGRYNLIKFFKFPPALQRAYDPRPLATLSFRERFGPTSRHLHTLEPPTYTYTAAHVPQVLWEVSYETTFAPFFVDRDMDPMMVRRMLAVMLVRLLNDDQYPHIAKRLRLPPDRTKGMMNKLMGIIRDAPWEAEFTNELHSVAHDLDHDPNRVDYAALRAAYQGFTEVPWRDWKQIAQQANMHVGKPGGRNRYAAIWIWAHRTEGDWRLAPGIQQGNVTNRKEVYRRFLTNDLHQIKDFLKDYEPAPRRTRLLEA